MYGLWDVLDIMQFQCPEYSAIIDTLDIVQLLVLEYAA